MMLTERRGATMYCWSSGDFLEQQEEGQPLAMFVCRLLKTFSSEFRLEELVQSRLSQSNITLLIRICFGTTRRRAASCNVCLSVLENNFFWILLWNRNWSNLNHYETTIWHWSSGDALEQQREGQPLSISSPVHTGVAVLCLLSTGAKKYWLLQILKSFALENNFTML